MPWYRTGGGRLIHGEGGLAAVYAARGWEEVPEDEVDVVELQVRADVEGEAGAAVDEAFRKANESHPVPTPDGSGLLTTSPGERQLTDEEQQLVDQVIDEESPSGRVRD
jgi:hypothetical protein